LGARFISSAEWGRGEGTEGRREGRGGEGRGGGRGGEGRGGGREGRGWEKGEEEGKEGGGGMSTFQNKLFHPVM
jgi:hypothetical protein